MLRLPVTRPNLDGSAIQGTAGSGSRTGPSPRPTGNETASEDLRPGRGPTQGEKGPLHRLEDSGQPPRHGPRARRRRPDLASARGGTRCFSAPLRWTVANPQRSGALEVDLDLSRVPAPVWPRSPGTARSPLLPRRVSDSPRPTRRFHGDDQNFHFQTNFYGIWDFWRHGGLYPTYKRSS